MTAIDDEKLSVAWEAASRLQIIASYLRAGRRLANQDADILQKVLAELQAKWSADPASFDMIEQHKGLCAEIWLQGGEPRMMTVSEWEPIRRYVTARLRDDPRASAAFDELLAREMRLVIEQISDPHRRN